MNIEQVEDKINKELLPLFGTGSHKTRRWLRKEGFKYCPSCKEIKSIDDFHPDRFNEGGLRAYCKTCNTKKNVNRRGKYKEMNTKQKKLLKIIKERDIKEFIDGRWVRLNDILKAID